VSEGESPSPRPPPAVREGVILLALCWVSVAHAQELPARYARRPMIDVARAQVGADLAIERYGLDGRGTALCVVDTGVDRSAFSQIVSWSDGERTWREPDLIGVPGDAHGHGTAMASIALGIAPAASLFVVSAYDAARGGFPDDRILDGVRFCRAAARDEGMEDRLVVLLSLGGHDGAHDGSGPFERALDQEAREVPIVVAAGNEGERAVHATGRLFGERTEVPLYIPRSAIDDPELALTVRFGGHFTITTPSGEITPSLALEGAVALEDASFVSMLRERDVRVVTIYPRESGEYTITLEGEGAFEIWIANERLGSTFLSAGLSGPHAVRGEQISIPATAEQVIAVGATISRPAFGAHEGEGAPRDPWAFSSLGPNAGGAPRPDLAAPGGWTLAALSRDVRDGDANNLYGGSLAPYRSEDGRIAVRGTSVSAAVVAGALLLALQHGVPAADPRALLIASARGDGRWRPDVGFGELDVLALLERWSGARDAAVVRGAISATRPFAGDDVLWLAARVEGESALPAGSVLRVELGDRAWTAPLHAGTARLAIAPSYGVIGSTIDLRASADGVPIDGVEVPVVIDRSARGVRIAGGCTIAARGSGGVAWIALLAALALRSRARASARLSSGLGDRG
jgi:hypothetical protein